LLGSALQEALEALALDMIFGQIASVVSGSAARIAEDT
jgi:hypothetical protein